jgi:uncharacterized protein with HEPN domain
MKDRTAAEFLSDARDHALEAHSFAAGLSQAAFDADRRSRLAVYFCLAVAGEALNEVPKDIRTLAPDIPWVAINGLRNRLVHGYWLIDTQIVLRIAQEDTTALVAAIERLMDKIR